MSAPEIVVFIENPLLEQKAIEFANQYSVPFVYDINPDDSRLYVVFGTNKIFLLDKHAQKPLTLCVDFVAGENRHRRLYGGGRGQMIAKAVGLNKRERIKVVDATVGLGADAFVLACLGCQMTMLERSPIAHILLQNGIQRALKYGQLNDLKLAEIVGQMQLAHTQAEVYLPQNTADVVYLDPMFPSRKKSAQVKKAMFMFHSIIGKDEDADQLLPVARECATYRVVVKRPRLAPFLADEKPTYQLEGKSTRFDIYVNKAF